MWKGSVNKVLVCCHSSLQTNIGFIDLIYITKSSVYLSVINNKHKIEFGNKTNIIQCRLVENLDKTPKILTLSKIIRVKLN